MLDGNSQADPHNAPSSGHNCTGYLLKNALTSLLTDALRVSSDGPDAAGMMPFRSALEDLR
jgi:hypothetical protein